MDTKIQCWTLVRPTAPGLPNNSPYLVQIETWKAVAFRTDMSKQDTHTGRYLLILD